MTLPVNAEDWEDGAVETFELRRCWASRMLWPFVRASTTVELGIDEVRIAMGFIGSADIPIRSVDRLSKMNWPWWGGIGVRLGRKVVAFTAAWGEVALLELSHPIQVKTPFKWTTSRIVIGVEDVDGFLRAVAHRRAALEALEASATTPAASR